MGSTRRGRGFRFGEALAHPGRDSAFPHGGDHRGAESIGDQDPESGGVSGHALRCQTASEPGCKGLQDPRHKGVLDVVIRSKELRVDHDRDPLDDVFGGPGVA